MKQIIIILAVLISIGCTRKKAEGSKAVEIEVYYTWQDTDTGDLHVDHATIPLSEVDSFYHIFDSHVRVLRFMFYKKDADLIGHKPLLPKQTELSNKED